MSQRCVVNAQELADCLAEHTTAIEEKARALPLEHPKSITQEFLDGCTEKLGLAEPKPKNRVLRALARALGGLL